MDQDKNPRTSTITIYLFIFKRIINIGHKSSHEYIHRILRNFEL